VANSPQARKRARQAIKSRLHNLSQKSEMRTAIKKVLKLIESKELANLTASYQEAVKKIDILAGRGLIHANKAARLKSRLNARVKAAAA
jgi:small subunit ribosomal protein S20